MAYDAEKKRLFADAFMAAYLLDEDLDDKQTLFSDFLEKALESVGNLLEKAKRSDHGLDGGEQALYEWSAERSFPEDLWALIKEKFARDENPIGVLTIKPEFHGETAATELRRRASEAGGFIAGICEVAVKAAFVDFLVRRTTH